MLFYDPVVYEDFLLEQKLSLEPSEYHITYLLAYFSKNIHNDILINMTEIKDFLNLQNKDFCLLPMVFISQIDIKPRYRIQLMHLNTDNIKIQKSQDNIIQFEEPEVLHIIDSSNPPFYMLGNILSNVVIKGNVDIKQIAKAIKKLMKKCKMNYTVSLDLDQEHITLNYMG